MGRGQPAWFRPILRSSLQDLLTRPVSRNGCTIADGGGQGDVAAAPSLAGYRTGDDLDGTGESRPNHTLSLCVSRIISASACILCSRSRHFFAFPALTFFLCAHMTRRTTD